MLPPPTQRVFTADNVFADAAQIFAVPVPYANTYAKLGILAPRVSSGYWMDVVSFAQKAMMTAHTASSRSTEEEVRRGLTGSHRESPR